MTVTLSEALHQATEQLSQAGIDSARLDAELLLSHVLGKDRTWLFTYIHSPLGTGHQNFFQDLIRRRTRREPLQYIIGSQEFWGLQFKVTPDVLIPRQETELIVESAIGLLRERTRLIIVDICTGSGCIAVSLAKATPDARVVATDKSGRALSIAKENAERHGVADRILFLEGDLLNPLAGLELGGKVDAIIANPPYIPSGDLPALQPEVRDFEPVMALIAGKEGTEIHQRIIADAARYLRRDGALIMEMGIGQAGVLTAIINATGLYTKPRIQKDLAGIERVILAQRNENVKLRE